jgi:peptidoglycan hydrolase-like protein with peptidoglycan-binding domain
VAPASNPEVAALPIVPDIKPAPPQTAKSVPPMQPTRDEITPRALQAHAEPSAPVTLAPGPRTLSASNTASSASVTASGELVLDIQQRLAALGYPDVPLNGQLGTSTRSAIMAFQRNSGLPMTGSIDSELLNRLRRTSPAAMRLVKGPEAIVPR